MFSRIANSQRLFQFGVVIALLILALSLGVILVLCYVVGFSMAFIGALPLDRVKRKETDS